MGTVTWSPLLVSYTYIGLLNANYDIAFFCTFNVPIFALTFFAHLTCQFLRVLLFAQLHCGPAFFFWGGGLSGANLCNAFTLQTFGMPSYAILKMACESDKNNRYKNW